MLLYCTKRIMQQWLTSKIIFPIELNNCNSEGTSLNSICDENIWTRILHWHSNLLLLIKSISHLKKLRAHSLTFLPSSRHFLGSFSSQRQSMNSLLGLSHWEPKWWAAAFSTAEDTLTCREMHIEIYAKLALRLMKHNSFLRHRIAFV